MALSFDRTSQETPATSLPELGSAPPARDFGSNADRQLALATPGAAPQVDPFTKKMNDELDPLLKTLEGSKKDADRQGSSVAVAEWARANMVDGDAVQRYLARTDITMEEKTATMGQLAVERARSEFLSGWSYEGGVDKGGSNGWENAGSNRGAFPSYYQDQVRTYDRANGAEWCTSFAGAMHKSVGLQVNGTVNADEANSPFWSGYRLNTWAQTGKSNSGKQLTPADQRVGAEQNGSSFIGNDTWSGLTGGLNKAKTPKDKAALASQFTATNGVPQAGDVMVLGRDNNYRGSSKSHTVMVDRYDPETQTLYTIEGNADNAVSSRKIDLRNPADAASIVSSVRMGADKYMDPVAQARIAEEMKANPNAEPVSAASLLGRAQAVNARLSGSAGRSGFIKDTSATGSPYTWQHGTGENNSTINTQ